MIRFTRASAVNKVKKLHFLLLYPLGKAPSQRFRFEQFIPFFVKEGYECTENIFYDNRTYSLLYKKGRRIILGLRIAQCFFRRCRHLFFIGKYDVIFIQRGAAPVGPPIFEWIIRYVYRKSIIYDFDDAIWINPLEQRSKWKRWLKGNAKVRHICKWSHTVVVGNGFLEMYAKKFSKNVYKIPTVVDTENKFSPAESPENKIPIIGWTGSHTTLPYLEAMEPVHPIIGI